MSDIHSDKCKDKFIQSIRVNSGEITEYSCAEALYLFCKDYFVYVENKGWYQYKYDTWEYNKECLQLKIYISTFTEFVKEELKHMREQIVELENRVRDMEEEDYENKDKINDLHTKIKTLVTKRTTLVQSQKQLTNVSFKNNVVTLCKELFLDSNQIIKVNTNYNKKIVTNGIDKEIDTIHQMKDVKWTKSNTYKRICDIVHCFHLTKSIILSRKLKEYFIENGVKVEEDKKNGHKIYIDYL
jgi:hypothetical protein